jgi:hypothetical protein
MRLPRVRFTVRRIIAVVAALGLTLGIIVNLVGWFLNPHITVTVFNETNDMLTEVVVAYQGGQRRAEQIMPGGSASSDIRSSGESGVTLSYRDSQGNLMVPESFAYIEPGYRGSFDIHVREEGIRLVDGIHADGYPGPWSVRLRPKDQMITARPH